MKINLHRRFKVLVLSFFMFSFLAFGAMAQTESRRMVVRDSVVRLIENYKNRINSLQANSSFTDMYQVIRLFSNEKSIIYNNLNEGGEYTENISIAEYLELMKRLFPDGIQLDYDLNDIRIGRPKSDLGNRKRINVTLKEKLHAVFLSSSLEKEIKLIFTIIYEDDNEVPGDFKIFGTALPIKKEQLLSLSLSPGISRVQNLNVGNDPMFNIPMRFGGEIDLHYRFFPTRRIGLEAGLFFLDQESGFSQSEMVPVGIFPSNLSDLKINTSFYYGGAKLGLVLRQLFGEKIYVSVSCGMRYSYLFYAEMDTRARNINTDQTYTDVLTDIEWEDYLKSENIELYSSLDISFPIKNGLKMIGGISYNHGISAIENYRKDGFQNTKYQGQYHVLLAEPSSSSITQSVLFRIGLQKSLN